MTLTDAIGNATSLLHQYNVDAVKPTTEDTTEKKAKKQSTRSNRKYTVYDGDKVAYTSESSADEYSRRFFIRTYIQPSVIDRFLKTCPWVHYWAYCYHDKDLDDRGEAKTPHTHITLYTYSRKTASAIEKNFDRLDAQTRSEGAQPEKTHVEIMRDTTIAWRYLRHLDDPDKYQYPENERICNDKGWWLQYERTDGLNDSSNNSGLAMFMDRLNGATCLEMTQRYGKDWLYHQKHIDDCIRLHLTETQGNKAIPFDQNLLDLILKASNFSRQDIAIFNTILSYVQRTCREEYGSSIDFYFREDKENA